MRQQKQKGNKAAVLCPQVEEVLDECVREMAQWKWSAEMLNFFANFDRYATVTVVV